MRRTYATLPPEHWDEQDEMSEWTCQSSGSPAASRATTPERKLTEWIDLVDGCGNVVGRISKQRHEELCGNCRS